MSAPSSRVHPGPGPVRSALLRAQEYLHIAPASLCSDISPMALQRPPGLAPLLVFPNAQLGEAGPSPAHPLPGPPGPSTFAPAVSPLLPHPRPSPSSYLASVTQGWQVPPPAFVAAHPLQWHLPPHPTPRPGLTLPLSRFSSGVTSLGTPFLAAPPPAGLRVSPSSRSPRASSPATSGALNTLLPEHQSLRVASS